MGIREDMLIRAQHFVDRKYVARCDPRQRAMGLAYVTAERQDLAREIVRFCINELGLYEQQAQETETAH